MKCSNCSSENIEKGIAIGKTAETGNIGPKYSMALVKGVSQMYCDMCLDCGELLRFYIKDKTNKKWVKRSGSLFNK